MLGIISYQIVYSIDTGNGYVYYESNSGRNQSEGVLGYQADLEGPVVLNESILGTRDKVEIASTLAKKLEKRELGFWKKVNDKTETWQDVKPTTTKIIVTD